MLTTTSTPPASEFEVPPRASTSHTANETLPTLSTGNIKVVAVVPFWIPLNAGSGTVRSAPALLVIRIVFTSPPLSAKTTPTLTETVPFAAWVAIAGE